MPASKANQRAVNKYKKANYDRIEINVPKGQKDVVQAHASARGESVNGFIGRAITEAMERDATQKPIGATQTNAAAGVVSLSPETPEHAGEAADVPSVGLSEALRTVRAAGEMVLPSRMRDAVKAASTAAGETSDAFLWRAIAALDAGATRTAGVVALPVETVEAAQAAADRTGESVEDFISRAVETQATRDSTSLRMGINPAQQE